MIGIAAVLLRLAKRRAGIFQKSLAIFTVNGKQTDAETGSYKKLLNAAFKRSGECFLDALQNFRNIFDAADFS